MFEIGHYLYLVGQPYITFSLLCQYAKERHPRSLIQYFSDEFVLDEEEFLEWLVQEKLISSETVAAVKRIQCFDLNDVIQCVFPVSGNEPHTGALKAYALLTKFIDMDKNRCKRVFHFLKNCSNYLYFYESEFWHEHISTHHVNGKEIVDKSVFPTRSSVRKLTLGQKLKLAELMSIDEWEAFYSSLEVDDANWREDDDECDDTFGNFEHTDEKDSGIKPEPFNFAVLQNHLATALQENPAYASAPVVTIRNERNIDHEALGARIFWSDEDPENYPICEMDGVTRYSAKTHGAALVVANLKISNSPLESEYLTCSQLLRIMNEHDVPANAEVLIHLEEKELTVEATGARLLTKETAWQCPSARDDLPAYIIAKYGAVLIITNDDFRTERPDDED